MRKKKEINAIFYERDVYIRNDRDQSNANCIKMNTKCKKKE